MENKFYLYQHVRFDSNVPFYIGIGTKQSKGQFKSIYARAFATEKGRTTWWKAITNKTKYKIEILFETDNIEIIKEKEIEYIEKYKNTLCNITKGGDNISPKCKKEVFQYSLDGKFIKKFESSYEVSRELNISTSSLNRCLIGKRKSNNFANFQWFYTFKGNNIGSIELGRNTTKKKVILYNHKERYIFNSRKDCAKFLKLSPSRITDLIKENEVYHGYNIENYEN
jgi:hypothetical protein